MKKLLLILLCLPLFYSCGEENAKASKKEKKSDLLRRKLKGKVKSISAKSFFPEEAYGIGDDKGVTSYYEDIFNEDGNIIESSSLEYRIGEKSRKFKYDKDGNLIESRSYENESLIMKTIYKIGKNEGSTSYNENGDIIYSSKYDRHKKVTEVFNEKGDIISISKYDSDENQTDLIKYNKGEVESNYKYKYDNYGNEIEVSFYLDGKIFNKESFKYDKNGNQISSRYYNSDGKLVQNKLFKYEYDIHDNWIIKTTFLDGNLKDARSNSYLENIIEREIIYYE